MSEETKTFISGCVCTVLLVGALTFGGIKCNNSNNAALTDCIKLTQKPIECKQAINR
jgi:hypothetical protein